jgi:hypothetical protein
MMRWSAISMLRSRFLRKPASIMPDGRQGQRDALAVFSSSYGAPAFERAKNPRKIEPSLGAPLGIA